MATVMAEFRAERQRTHDMNGHRPAKRTPVLVVLAGVLATVARFAARRLPRWAQVRTAVMAFTAFGLITAAAWMIAVPLGLLSAGLSLLVIEALSGPGRA
jgi:hypothetical protein